MIIHNCHHISMTAGPPQAHKAICRSGEQSSRFSRHCGVNGILKYRIISQRRDTVSQRGCLRPLCKPRHYTAITWNLLCCTVLAATLRRSSYLPPGFLKRSRGTDNYFCLGLKLRQIWENNPVNILRAYVVKDREKCNTRVTNWGCGVWGISTSVRPGGSKKKMWYLNASWGMQGGAWLGAKSQSVSKKNCR